MTDCLFCKIVAGDIPAEKVYEDDVILAFNDIHPKAPVHVLVIPKQHVDSLFDINDSHDTMLSYLMRKLPEIAKQQGLNSGFRTIINTGAGGGQEIPHLHCHILGGKASLSGF